MAKYVLKGTKQQGGVVNSVQVDDDRVLVLDGEPVELSEEEHKTLSQSYNLRKAADDSTSDGNEGDSDGNEGDTGDGSPKGGENE